MLPFVTTHVCVLHIQDGRILGCQAVGEGEGVDKVVDVMATLIQKEGTVYDLEEAELCYGGWGCSTIALTA
jgi:hypothetical protein